ncbi:MAG: efflux RND transporter periplasmic adaptor subunit, partial [Muribaculaceae bacterium]|nr:efflux RND transporter periplasmic adaptor subunit [Muribaculaceae bacterium]
NDVWVTANFKETQLPHILPGNKVEIKVAAIPGKTFEGTVSAISTATGASLSLIPQDNSSGNFVKVRKRVPVRIDLDPSYSAEDLAKLRAGMNVECLVKY